VTVDGSRLARRPPPAFWFSLIAGTSLLAVSAGWYELADALTPFLAGPLLLLALALCVLAGVWSLHYLLEWLGRDRLAAAPLLVVVGACCLMRVMGATHLVERIDFHVHRAERERVVALIEAGILVPNVAHNASLIHLPDDFPMVSKGGNEVVLEESGRIVEFYTYRGILSTGSSAFVYTADGEPPAVLIARHRRTRLVRLDEHWHWMSYR
jgi:hypothetical protein